MTYDEQRELFRSVLQKWEDAWLEAHALKGILQTFAANQTVPFAWEAFLDDAIRNPVLRAVAHSKFADLWQQLEQDQAKPFGKPFYVCQQRAE